MIHVNFIEPEGSRNRLPDLVEYLNAHFRNQEQMEQQVELLCGDWGAANGYRVEFDDETDEIWFISQDVLVRPGWRPPRRHLRLIRGGLQGCHCSPRQK